VKRRLRKSGSGSAKGWLKWVWLAQSKRCLQGV
jgi:hypothetical protein